MQLVAYGDTRVRVAIFDGRERGTAVDADFSEEQIGRDYFRVHEFIGLAEAEQGSFVEQSRHLKEQFVRDRTKRRGHLLIHFGSINYAST